MSSFVGERFQHSGWQFVMPKSASEMSPYARERLIETVLKTIAGTRGAPLRRSRNATTWRVRLSGGGERAVGLFVKQLDPPSTRIDRVKRFFRKRRAEHVAAISEELRSRGFDVPMVLLAGWNPGSGIEVIATEHLPGHMVTRWMRTTYRHDLPKRRAILHALGEEVARLHRAGYIHGDLTPYNIFVTSGDPPRIALVDHERTRHWSPLRPNLYRQRVRNLVQLGHFVLPGVSRTDKFRVFASYVRARGINQRAAARRLLAMLRRRIGAAGAGVESDTAQPESVGSGDGSMGETTNG